MSAFPEGVVVQRVGLATAVETTRTFLREGDAPPAPELLSRDDRA
jgi:hypothetical protein